ncbi:hypothetical protein RFI_15211 [Reticulomyxa filosa]|uniref:Fe2OG dioxygenase domain-containing protein n=1 Tax=Reticulomyxa filosa TaxID=46433 RepID=X6N9L7_RETFI|nr:hypothetical protein RFI_15211 [Reticulomyxa filosa]|eukprot:ETO21992.1 hypothetical protein RFI_15211 [Reticulomyxa filosa]
MQSVFYFFLWLLVFGQCHISSVEVDSSGEAHAYEETHTYEEEEEMAELRPVAVVIKNPRSSWIDYYWQNPESNELLYQGKIDPRGTSATSSYAGHVFVFAPAKKGPEKEFARVHVTEEKNLYILPLEEDNSNENDIKYYQQLLEEQRFVEDYRKRTGRPTHHVSSNEYFWKCIPENSQDPSAIEKCRDTQPVSFALEALSTEPKVFRINNGRLKKKKKGEKNLFFKKKQALSDFEADLVISLAKPKIKRSLAGTHGGLVSNTRTSRNTWLDRNEHLVMETLYRRAADILNISESVLYPDKNVEQLQVVNYQVGQEYTSHHDFGADGHPQQRMITLLFYLNNQTAPDAGGETAFPKAKNGYLKVHAGKGNAVLFYSMLEDGNADDLSLHAALPVKKGEKWIGMLFFFFYFTKR